MALHTKDVMKTSGKIFFEMNITDRILFLCDMVKHKENKIEINRQLQMLPKYLNQYFVTNVTVSILTFLFSINEHEKF